MTGTTRVRLSIAIGAAVGVVTFAAVAPGGGGDAPPPATTTAASLHEGRAVFARMGCGSCHRLAAAGSTGRIGPNLDARLAGHDRASLVAAIVRAPGPTTAMPDDFGARMTDAELDALVSFLLAAGARQPSRSASTASGSG